MDQLEILKEAIEENTEAIEAIEVTNHLHEELWVYLIEKILSILKI